MSKTASEIKPVDRVREEGFKTVLKDKIEKYLEMEDRFKMAIDMTIGECDLRTRIFVDVCECLADCYTVGVQDLDRVVLSVLAANAEKYPRLIGDDGGERAALWMVSKTCELIARRGASGNILLGRIKGEIDEIKGKVDHVSATLEEDLG